jgi:hypothetical protein
MDNGKRPLQVKRNSVILLIVFSLSSSIPPLANILGSPQFQEIRGLDVVRLIVIGAFWGVAVAGLALLIAAGFRKAWRAINRSTLNDRISIPSIATLDGAVNAAWALRYGDECSENGSDRHSRPDHVSPP